MIANIFLSFIEGIGLILSPCILPVLPIILSAGLEGGHKRPYGIIIGFVGAFSLLTLFSRQLVIWIGVDISIVRIIGFYLLFFFGLILLIDRLALIFDRATAWATHFGEKFSSAGEKQGGFIGGIIIGMSLGLIWTPCAGPILAIVLIQVIQGEAVFLSAITLLAFAVGVSLPMLSLVLLGRHFYQKITFLKHHTHLIRRLLGLIIIITVWITGGAEMLGSKPHFTAQVLPSLENVSSIKATTLLKGVPSPYPAPDIQGGGAWLNSPSLTLKDLKGKVVLIDFWTYSCINCVRTLPYLTSWDRKYRNKGLVIIGVHAPEFEFEKRQTNVEAAISQHNIQYPVVMDNNFIWWKAFENHYWPAHFLINKDGQVVYVHFGEGEYDTTENNIRFLLGLGATEVVSTPPSETNSMQTPETYLGLLRTSHFSSPQRFVEKQKTTYTYPSVLPLHHWALSGAWISQGEYIESGEKGASLKLHFLAKKVFLVLASKNGHEIQATIKVNGKNIEGNNAGKDLEGGRLIVTKETLYELVNLSSVQEGELEIITNDPGLRAYAFTFGG
jgi:cytochrome c biogenesis protein CcdA/thiol-disulfide isomerase/thioredoxin